MAATTSVRRERLLPGLRFACTASSKLGAKRVSLNSSAETQGEDFRNCVHHRALVDRFPSPARRTNIEGKKREVVLTFTIRPEAISSNWILNREKSNQLRKFVAQLRIRPGPAESIFSTRG